MAPWRRRRPDTVSRKCAVEDGTGGPKRKKFKFGRPYRFENSTSTTVFFRLKDHVFELQEQPDGKVMATSTLKVEVDTDPAAKRFKSAAPINIIYTIKYEDGQGKPTILPKLMEFEFSPDQHGPVTKTSAPLDTIRFDQIHSVCWAISHYTVDRA